MSLLPDRCDVCGETNHAILFSVRAIVAGDDGPKPAGSCLVCSGSCAMLALTDPGRYVTPPAVDTPAEPVQEVSSPDPAA